MSFTTKRTAAAIAAASLGLLGACSSDDSDDSTETSGSDGADKSLSIGVPAGWDEGVVLSNMAKIALEEQGYEVDLTDAEIGLIFTSISKGDMDLLLDAWLPITHASYIDKYGDDMEDLGTWYDDAKLAIAVNDDAPIDSIDELADNADVFGNEIVGIDAGAGLTEVTQDDVIPTYGLEDMKFTISSTAAMLAELKGAMANDRDIAVTLWSPHWAYDAYDIRDLEDPEGAYGGAEEVHSFARLDFSDDYPEIAEMFSNLTISDEELSSVENYVLNDNADRDIAETTAEWLDDNPDTRALFDLSE